MKKQTPSVREVALKILYSVEKNKAYSDILFAAELEKNNFSHRDKALLKELISGSLKMQLYLDWVLSQFLNKKIETLTIWIRNILRLGLYQILFLDKIPPSAATNEAVNLAKQYGHLGTAKLVNGILRNILRNRNNITLPDAEKSPIDYISVKYSHPKWLVKRWIERYGIDETEIRCKANNLPAPNTIRVNTAKITPSELKALLLEDGFQVNDTINPKCFNLSGNKPPQQCLGFAKGLFYLQDAAFTFVPQLLGAKPDEMILDMCAAPGGKTVHMAEMMGNQGKIIAIDSNKNRLKKVKENCKRMGVNIVTRIQGKAEEFSYSQYFDKILVDAPCSDIGVWRRRADARWHMSEDKINQLAKLQYQILQNAAQLLKTGGIIVYGTCTTEPEENENIIKKFLDENNNFSLEDAKFYLPSKVVNNSGFLSTSPGEHQTDVAFAARLRKK